MLVLQHRTEAKFPPALLPAASPAFWDSLSVTESVLRPLTLASFVLQRSAAGLADLFHMIRMIYASFLVSPRHAELTPLIESRFADLEQPLVYLAYFIHPYYLLNYGITMLAAGPLTIPHVIQLGQFYYTRLTGLDGGANLRRQLFAYLRNKPLTSGARISDFTAWDELFEFLSVEGSGCVVSCVYVIRSDRFSLRAPCAHSHDLFNGCNCSGCILIFLADSKSSAGWA